MADEIETIEDVFAIEMGAISKSMRIESAQSKTALPSPRGDGRLISPYNIEQIQLGCGVSEHMPVEMMFTTRGTVRMTLPLHSKIRVNITQKKAVIILP